jgi:hypothetical protein
MARHLVPPALPSNIPAGPTQPADLSEPIVAADEHRDTVSPRDLAGPDPVCTRGAGPTQVYVACSTEVTEWPGSPSSRSRLTSTT